MPFKNQHPLYSIWQGMRRRCLAPTAKAWGDYGGRGISICPEWDDFHQFVRDMGPRPKGHTLERIDNEGNYKRDNCRWATRKDQQRNRRNTVKVLIEGTEYLVAELAELSGWKADTIIARVAKGMSYDQVMSSSEYINKTAWKKAVAVRVANQRNATHCKHGHAWTPENTYFTKEGWKNCRECQNAKMRRLNAKKRALMNTTPP